MAHPDDMKKADPRPDPQESASTPEVLNSTMLLDLLRQGRDLRQRMDRETASMGIIDEDAIRLRFR